MPEVSAEGSLAISSAIRLKTIDFYTLKSRDSTVGGGVGFFLAGMLLFLLVDVAFFVVDTHKNTELT